MEKAKGRLANQDVMTKAVVVVPVLIFLLFLLGVLFSIYYLPYLLIPLILANIALLIVNKRKGIPLNIVLFFLSLLLFVFLIEYFAYVLGTIISLYQAARVLREYLK